MKLKVYLSAYCRKNLGDDLFVETVLRRYPNVLFYMRVGKGERVAFEKYPNVRFVSPLLDFGMRVLKKARILSASKIQRLLMSGCDAYVKIGGSIFMEPRNWIGALNTVENPNTFYIGCNFGPYVTEAYKESVKGMLHGLRDCCFRDRYSYELFQDVPSVRVAADVLFGYEKQTIGECGKALGISVICLDQRRDLSHLAETYYQTVSQVCEECQRRGIPVKLLAFCKAEGDEKAISQVLSRMASHQGIEACVYDGDTDLFLNTLNGCQWILATRFHAMVLGWTLKKQVVPIVYSRKQTHVLEDMGYLGQQWDLLGEQSCEPVELLEACLNNGAVDISQFAQDSQRQFAKLDGFVNLGE